MAKKMTLTINGVKPNNITVTHPEVAKQWDYEKNGDLRPEMFTKGSDYKPWWVCSKDSRHTWQAMISNRVKGRGCPVCAGKLVIPGVNDLASKNPNVASSWCYERNGDVTPETIAWNSHRKFWWACTKDPRHVWEAQVYSRTVNGSGCQVCNNRVAIKGVNDLATTHTDLLADWDYELNDKTPEEVTCKSSYRAHWVCHVHTNYKWETTVRNRAINGTGCRICSGISVGQFAATPEPGESLAEVRPDIAESWCQELNGDLTPYDVKPHSLKKVWWRCQKKDTHKWLARVSNRVNLGNDCPICSGRLIVAGENDIATTHPHLMDEWNYELNDKMPQELGYGSHYRAHWTCCNNPEHKWVAEVKTRTNGSGCPRCAEARVGDANAKPKSGQYLSEAYPEIAKEWCYRLNGSNTPENVACKSGKSFFWQCSKCKEIYQSVVCNRTRLGEGCPHCKSKLRTSLPEKAFVQYLWRYGIVENAGSDYIEGLGRRTVDIYLPSKRTAFEYDGQAWHKDPEKDKEKDRICEECGIRIIRVREPKCPVYESNAEFVYLRDLSKGALQEAVIEVIRLIGEEPGDIDMERDWEYIKILRDCPPNADHSYQCKVSF